MAAPQVWFRWDRTTGIIPTLTASFSGPTILHTVIAGTNFGGGVRGFDLVLLISSPEPAFPDAWRFDPEGCQASALAVRALSSALNAPYW